MPPREGPRSSLFLSTGGSHKRSDIAGLSDHLGLKLLSRNETETAKSLCFAAARGRREKTETTARPSAHERRRENSNGTNSRKDDHLLDRPASHPAREVELVLEGEHDDEDGHPRSRRAERGREEDEGGTSKRILGAPARPPSPPAIDLSHLGRKVSPTLSLSLGLSKVDRAATETSPD